MVREAACRVMPDIASDARVGIAGALGWVGMGEIEVPVTFASDDGRQTTVPSRVTAYVNLARPDKRGIHMSRLYLAVDRAFAAEPLTPRSLRQLLREFLASHEGLSDRALLKVRFDHMVRRPALASANLGWKSYPVEVTGLLDRGQFSAELATGITYSSTCPCSAALARQLIQERFQRDFPRDGALDYGAVLGWLGTEEGICATPHSQRSIAEVRTRIVPSFTDFPILDLIDRIEGALKTPVQAAVKREDEQAFARLNGENLMFCEDAARRMQAALDDDDRIADFWVRATHYESLHPHNAVAVAVKGIEGGFEADAGGPEAIASHR
jgi:GTP cyclohydrolase I